MCFRSVGDAELRSALIHLFIRADNYAKALLAARGRITVVLVSRRLSCVYEMIVADGFSGFAGVTVVSDRALWGSVRLEKDQPVLLVDDAMILGTTLVDLFDDIVTHVGDKSLVKVMVACVDQERHNPLLALHLGLSMNGPEAPLLRSTKELEASARDIASCLFRSGRPYFTDFPLVRSFDLPAAAWTALAATRRWMVVDVSPPIGFAGEDRRAFTFVPGQEVDDLIRARACREAMELTEGIKVRVYIGPGVGDGHVSLRVVPIGLPGAMMPGRLVAILTAIEQEIKPGPYELSWRSWKPEAQHRFLQMYVSTCVLVEFWNDLQATGLTVQLESTRLEDVHVRCYFGNEDAPRVLNYFDWAVASYLRSDPDREPAARAAALIPRSGLARLEAVSRWALTSGRMVDGTSALIDRLNILRGAVPPKRPEPGEIAEIDLFWVHRVLSIFGAVDRVLEREQERGLHDYDYEQYKKYREAGGDERLGPRVIKLGISLAELSTRMVPDTIAADTWTQAVVSLAIDVGNDLGVVVPSTVIDDARRGPVWRQYRSGEMAYATSVPHEQLYGCSAQQLLERMDPFTRDVLADLTKSEQPDIDVVADFGRETNQVVAQSRAYLPVLQAWVGRVIDVEGFHFGASVTSRLVDGLMTRAHLPRSALTREEDAALAVGSGILWTVLDARDLLGRPTPMSEIRLVSTPTAD